MLSSGFTHWRANCSFGPGGSSGRGWQPHSLANRRREEERRWQERPRGRSRRARGQETAVRPCSPPPRWMCGLPGEPSSGIEGGRGAGENTQGWEVFLSLRPRAVSDSQVAWELEAETRECEGARRRIGVRLPSAPSALQGLAQGVWTSLLERSTIECPQHLPALFRGQEESAGWGGAWLLEAGFRSTSFRSTRHS